MSRSSRIRSSTGIYHVMLRGIDKRIIFSDDMDRMIFIKRVKRAKDICGFKLYAYCLMDNHIHMLIKEESEPLELIFKRIGVSYVAYYNKKHQLYGHLYQDRFRSEPVETQEYFLDVIRYICQNPVKAGLCSSPSEYKWLGCYGFREESGLLDNPEEIVSLSENAIRDLIGSDCHHPHIDDIGRMRLTDQDAIDTLCKISKCALVQDISRLDKSERIDILNAGLKAGISARQLSRITGIGRNIIVRARNK